jgi:hypothetical protein
MKISFLKTCTLSLSLAISLFSFQSCGTWGLRATGDYVTQNFNDVDFNGLDLRVPAKAEVRIDSVFKLEISCEETALPFLQTEVSNGILHIEFDRNVYDVDDMKIIVSAPSWDYFELNSSGSIRIIDPIAGNKLKMEVSGSGRMECNRAVFNFANLEVSGSGEIISYDAIFNQSTLEISGSGAIELDGEGDDLRCEVDGSGNINCLDFPVKTARVEISGSGNVKLDASEQLNVEISGSGDVYYQGDANVNANISGSGKVKKY